MESGGVQDLQDKQDKSVVVEKELQLSEFENRVLHMLPEDKRKEYENIIQLRTGHMCTSVSKLCILQIWYGEVNGNVKIADKIKDSETQDFHGVSSFIIKDVKKFDAEFYVQVDAKHHSRENWRRQGFSILQNGKNSLKLTFSFEKLMKYVNSRERLNQRRKLLRMTVFQ